MKIQYYSDLHLEFTANSLYLKKKPIIPSGEILVLAGDIVPFALVPEYDYFFDFVSAHFEYTYWLPGNHEYYQSDAAAGCGILHKQIRHNVFLVNNFEVIHKNTRLIFSTLWSEISHLHSELIQQRLSDFHQIQFNGALFTPLHYNELHHACKKFILKKLHEKKLQPTIVVTHHVPTFLHYPAKYKREYLNEAFAVELADEIEKANILYWIYGHHHFNTPEFEIGNTKMLTNQLGYVKYKEMNGFKRDVVLDIPDKI